MCGIFGYQGKETHAQNILLNGLKRLEYRGYDSAGLLVGNQKEIKLVKAIGKVSNLSEKVQKEINAESQFSFGIAHTRWATHGGITENNTHPHYDNKQQFYLVHNGIIENYHKLKKELIAKGYEFYGQTDSEVIANLLTEHRNGNLLETVEKTLQIIKGAYALLIVSPLAPGEMIAAKIGSPLLFGHDKENNFFLSSDKQGLVSYADQLTYLEDGDVLHIKDNEYTITSKGAPAQKSFEEMDIQELEHSKGDFKHFMLKEIFEQANIIRRIFKGRVSFQNKLLNAEAFHGMQNENCEVEIILSNNPEDILKYTKNVLVSNIHNRKNTKEILLKQKHKKVLGLDEILNQKTDKHGYNETFGLLGTNLATDEMLKLFPHSNDPIVNKIKSEIKKLTNKDIHVMIYGDGAFKDPVGGIWELADPVVSPSYTKGLQGSPNEIKLKYLIDKYPDKNKKELQKIIQKEISLKNNSLTEQNKLGTTPRHYVDLLGSLADLISGSGEKGTPVVYIKNYFKGYND